MDSPTTFNEIIFGDTIAHPVYGTRVVGDIIPSALGRQAIVVHFSDGKSPGYIQTYRWSRVQKVEKK